MTLAAIEFDPDGRVCRILRTTGPRPGVLDILATGHRFDEYDVDWCQRDESLFKHRSGSHTGRVYLSKLVGPSRCKLWARDGVTFSTSNNGQMISVAEVSELGYDLIQSERPPEAFVKQIRDMRSGPVHYCDACDDMIPDLDECLRHEYWCDDCGNFFQRSDPCEHYCRLCGEVGPDDCGCGDHQ